MPYEIIRGPCGNILQSKIVHVDAARNECCLSDVIWHMSVLVLVVILRCLHWLRPPPHVRPGGLGILFGIKLTYSYTLVISNNSSKNGLCITGLPVGMLQVLVGEPTFC